MGKAGNKVSWSKDFRGSSGAFRRSRNSDILRKLERTEKESKGIRSCKYTALEIMDSIIYQRRKVKR